LVAQLVVLVLKLDGEGRIIGALEDHRTAGLPDKAVSGAGADAVPEGLQVEVGPLGWKIVVVTTRP
jgi:hypothetical protein